MSWLHGGSRTIAGKFGARWSRLVRDGYLSTSHYDVNLTKAELRRITLWLDGNSLEMPSFSLDSDIQKKARQGELVWPDLDVNPKNPQGIEQDRTSSFSIDESLHDASFTDLGVIPESSVLRRKDTRKP
jgi:hypothetical protein